jgi:acyl-CoA thioester hydrolase
MAETHGHIDAGTHLFPVRVYFEDTDAGGIVYHARYLHFMERARTEMMRCLTIPHAQMTADHGVLFAVRKCEIDYLSPARLDDSLEVLTRIAEIGGASLIATQWVRRNQETLVQARIRLACITLAGRVARIPPMIGRGLQPLAGNTRDGE